MPKILHFGFVFFVAVSFLGFVLWLAGLLANQTSLAATTAALGQVNFTASGAETQPARPFAAASTGTFQDFDQPGTGTPYATGTHILPPFVTSGPQLIVGGPTEVGKLMRLALAYTTTSPITLTHNSIAFDYTAHITPDLIVADFDLRMTPSSVTNDRADGMGFALLNTSNYGITGIVTPTNTAEEPNFVNSLGIGFDIHKFDGPPPERNNDHISIHFNGKLVREFDAKPAVDLGGGQWIHARIIMRPGGGYSDVTVILTPCGRPAMIVVDRFRVPGFVPYQGRVYFAARSGGLSADHDIDNVHVQFLTVSQSVLAFDTGCYSVVETEGELLLTVTRTGNPTGMVTVNYATVNSTAQAGADYTATVGTLTFNNGEMIKTLNVPIHDDTSNEGDESFLVSLNNPSGNAGVGGPAIAKVTIVDNESAKLKGHWSEFIPSQVVPIHMHLLPNGKIMYWDRHDHERGWDGYPRLWDPATERITTAKLLAYDIFCSGHSFMADGRLLVTGGHIADGVGDDKASLYNPFTNSWTRLPDMNAGRWYPSNVTLPNGDVLVIAGTYEFGVNGIPQVWQTATNTWRNLTNAEHGGPPNYADYYPFLYVAPNGQVFNAGPQQMAHYLDTSGTGDWIDVDSSDLPYRDYGSSVMYDDGKVLIVGGNPREPDPTIPPTIPPSTSTEVINLNDANPVWRPVAPMSVGRRHLNTTLLPDGQVLVTGGSSAPGFDNAAGAVLKAEMWNPTTEQWTDMAAQTRYRGYHSTALLLPDGRVLVGGGGHPDPPGGAQYNFEIYSPPYLFNGPRPTITSAPRIVSHGQTFLVQTPNAAGISAVNWIRLSSVTHAFNQNQRINHLNFEQTSSGLNVTVPSNTNLAPLGHYMLFILNSNGVPSMAHIIQVVSPIYLPFISKN